MAWSAKLAELGLTLPPVAAPAGAYIPALRSGSLVYTAGQIPLRDGKIAVSGKVGAGLTVDQGRDAARICALNTLAAVDSVAGLDTIVRIVKVTGFVASAPGFTDQPLVLNGASELYQEIFGPAGVHVRSAVGVLELPRGAAVEVELVVEVG